uniref:Uncharacterized protein n=1 Tax=Leersia perrieri TaxID=77586 RepID=A0A0D9WVL2_9ORYZ
MKQKTNPEEEEMPNLDFVEQHELAVPQTHGDGFVQMLESPLEQEVNGSLAPGCCISPRQWKI